MRKSNYLLWIAGLVAGATSLSATTVIPPSFDQLVNQAEQIFRGTVTKVTSDWIGEGAERHIVSFITFKVKDSIKGSPGDSYTIRTFGGTVDGETMAIADGPVFHVGDEDFLFVENNGTQVVPLVGIMYGRFHVRKDNTGQESITTNEDRPLRDVAALDRPGTESASAPVLSPAAFKAAIQAKLQGGQSDSNQSRN
ncbi:MAG: hypothetical protein ACJ8M1_15000 [Chthoniobacterales bacterium]